MKSPIGWTLALVVAAAAGFGGYHFGRTHAVGAAPATEEVPSTQPAEEAAAPVPVKVSVARAGEIHQKVIAYGSITARPGDVAAVSVPFESRVGHIAVMPGQVVEAGAVVAEIEPSADTQLQVLQAKATLASATKDLEQAKQRFGEHLATNTDLLTAQQNLDAATLKFDAFNSGGAIGAAQVKSPKAGVVGKVNVQEGQIAAAGTLLLEIIPADRAIARLGVEASDAANIHTGDKASLNSVADESADAIEGVVEMVAHKINPDTRLTDIFVRLPSESKLTLDSSICGELTTGVATGVIVPRNAVTPDDQGWAVFVVKDQKATKHTVKLGLKNGEDVQVIGDGVAAGDSVVVQGNLELDDGSAVTIADNEEPAATPTTAPTTAPTAGATP